MPNYGASFGGALDPGRTPSTSSTSSSIPPLPHAWIRQLFAPAVAAKIFRVQVWLLTHKGYSLSLALLAFFFFKYVRVRWRQLLNGRRTSASWSAGAMSEEAGSHTAAGTSEAAPSLLLNREGGLIPAVSSSSALTALSGATQIVGSTRTAVRNALLRWLGFPELLDARLEYRTQVDFNRVQACLLSAEHIEIGRVEKRTLFVRRLDDLFPNQYLRAKIMKAALLCVESPDEEVVLPVKLSVKDKWVVLNTCTNCLSELFAPAHLFFNEARQNTSFYRSAWYVFTITCTRNQAGGRFFVTPSKRVVGEADVGQLCLRIICVSEQELRKIASGEIEEPANGFFNERHAGRWRVLQRIANLFVRQLENVAGQEFDGRIDWGANLCGRLGATALERRKMRQSELGLHSTAYSSLTESATASLAATGAKNSSTSGQHHHQVGQQAGRFASMRDIISNEDDIYHPEDNCFLRIHIPFPGADRIDIKDRERRCQDVVLYS
mmetsp:Transcript_25181/g.63379  ORF Transcript_25181/g.63379 Transcript_25181/m.63379 type:complete len:494 (-) Transcript_25181:778-2259(-)